MTDATVGPRSTPPGDRSRTNPRAGLIAALSTSVAELSAAGDLEAAQVAAQAMMRLLTEATNSHRNTNSTNDQIEERKT